MNENENEKLENLGQDFNKIFYPDQYSDKFVKLPQEDEPQRGRPISYYSLINPKLCLNVNSSYGPIEEAINSVFSNSEDHDESYFLVTAKTDNQNTKLDNLVEELLPTYIYKVSGKECEIVTSIYEIFCMAFYDVVIRLTDNQFRQIDETSIFKIVFNQLDENFINTSGKIVNSNVKLEEKGKSFIKAFSNILEKCINIYVIY